MRRAYSSLLRLYPWDYRARFATEMLAAFEDAAEHASGPRFFFSEFAGLVTGAAAEWSAKLTTDKAVRARSLPDLRMMRPVGITREEFFLGIHR